jgi:hypothetical protein
MSTKQISILLIELIILGLIVFGVRGGIMRMNSAKTPTIPEGVACTMDAKMCPDGSYVGRIPPSCNFAACPVTATSHTPVTTSYTTSIGQVAGSAFLNITPFEIVEESRCPIDVLCIHAGTVRVKAHVFHSGTTTDEIFGLNNPVTIASTSINLVQVLPLPQSKVKITPASYRFTFEITE